MRVFPRVCGETRDSRKQLLWYGPVPYWAMAALEVRVVPIVRAAH